MQTKSFYNKNLIILALTLIIVLLSQFNFNTVRADSVIEDYSVGGYLEVTFAKTTIINMPDGTKGEDRSNWNSTLVNTGDKFEGWYRAKLTADRTNILNVELNINGENLVKTLSHVKNFDNSVVLFNGVIESDIVEIQGQNYVEFYIPKNLDLRIKYNDVKYNVTSNTYTFCKVYDGAEVYSIVNPNPVELPSDRTMLSSLNIGVVDDVNRSNYVTYDKNVYSLSNAWFRFKKPANVFTTTTDIANVKTTLDGEKYSAILHYVIDDNGNKSLMLGRFNVDYKIVEIKGEEYIEFCIPKSNVKYYNTKESIVEHTLKIGVMDTIRPIDESFVRLEYNLTQAIKNDVNTVTPYADIFGILGGLLLASATLLIISIKRNKKNNHLK